MTNYRVVSPFADLLDDNYVYRVGDTFPRRGVIVKAERYKELMGRNNKIGKPLIEEVADNAHETGRKSPVEAEGDNSIAESKKPVKKASTTRKSRK